MKYNDDFEVESGLEPDPNKRGRVGDYRFDRAPYRTVYVSGSTIGTVYIRIDFSYSNLFAEAEVLKQLFNSRGVKVTKWKVNEELKEKVLVMINAALKIARQIRDDAKRMCPKVTHRLERSISVSWSGSPVPIVSKDVVLPPVQVPGKFSIVVGSSLEYAPFVEWGTKYMAPNPFLRSAFLHNYQKFTPEMRAAVKFKVVRERYFSYGQIPI